MKFKVTKSPPPDWGYSIVMNSESKPTTNEPEYPIITHIKTESEATFLMFILEQGFTIGWNQASHDGTSRLYFI